MSSSPTCDALATILDALASRLETLELVMKDLGTRNVPAVDVRTAFSNILEGFHTPPTKGKGKKKASPPSTMAPPSAPSSSKAKLAKESKSTKNAAMHSPHLPQARTFPTEGNTDKHFITVIILAASTAHVVGKGGKGLKQIHDISGARVAAFEVAASLDEHHISLQGTNLQIGDALNVLGKRLARKRVHYPKGKKAAASTSSTTAPPPTPMARPLPSASSKLHVDLPPSTVDKPSTSGIVEVPSTEHETDPISKDDESPISSPTPSSTPMVPTASTGTPTSTLPPLGTWTPLEVDAVLAFAGPNSQEFIATTTDVNHRRALAVHLVELEKIPHPSQLSSGPAHEARHRLQTAHRSDIDHLELVEEETNKPRMS